MAQQFRLVKYDLGGGLEHLGIILPIDFHIFQDGLNHQPVIIYREHCLTHPHLQP